MPPPHTAPRRLRAVAVSIAASVLVMAFSTILPPAAAHSGDEILSPWLATPVVLDGNLTAGEWADAVEVDLIAANSSNTLPAYLYVKNDGTDLYLAFDAVGDTSLDENDYASVAFDTGHDGAVTNGAEHQFLQSTTNTSIFSMLYPPGNQAHFAYALALGDWVEEDNPFDPGLPNHTGLAGGTGFGTSPRAPGTTHRTYEMRLPLVLLGASPGDALGFLAGSSPIDAPRWGVLDALTASYSTWPAHFTADPTLAEYGNLVLGTPSGDLPPVVSAYGPGGSPAETYLVGALIPVTWNATDDNPLPADAINLTYGAGVVWTAVNAGAYSHANDGLEVWDTAAAAPGTYSINVSAYDSAGQETFDLGNFTFQILLPDATPPEVEGVRLNGLPAESVPVGTTVAITATLNDTATGGSPVADANYTIGAGNWAGATPMVAADALFDEVVEDVVSSPVLDTSAMAVGFHDVCVYGSDIQGNANTTGMCAVLELLPPDTEPPEIANVTLNGGGVANVNLSALPPVTLNATVDDRATGASSVQMANYTLGPQNWPGANMTAADGLYNGALEDATALVTPPGANGTYAYCVYASDVLGNANTTGSCATLILADDVEPAVPAVLLNGSLSLTVPEFTPSIILDATVDDSGRGFSWVANASYRVDAGPATAMALVTPPGDAVAEDFTATVDTSTLAIGTHAICIHGADDKGNVNATGRCATLTVVPVGTTDTEPPEIYAVLLSPNTLPLSAIVSVTVTAIVDDAARGDSTIGNANVTFGAANWASAVAMAAADGGYDEANETVTASVVPSAVVGTHTYCVYAVDSWSPPNANTTGACATLTVVDDLPPTVGSVRLDGSTAVTVDPGTPVALTATLDDTSLGNAGIAFANYTLGPQDWATSTPMDATDGAFDGVVEPVNATVDTTGWPVGITPLCVYGADAFGNANITGACATLTIRDNLPPALLGVGVNRTTVNQGETVRLNATVNDTATGTSLIANASWSVGLGNVTFPMSATDGTFNAEVEDVTAVVDTAGWASGTYTLYVFAYDAAGNGNLTGQATATLVVFVPSGDLEPPTFGAPGAIPDPQTVGGAVNVSVTVTDNVGVATVWLEVTAPGGNSLGNVTMAYDAASGRYFREDAFGTEGAHDFTIRAADTSGNWNATTGSFTVLATDVTPPSVGALSTEPATVTRGDSVNLSVVVTDVRGVAEVWIEIRDPDGNVLANVSATFDPGSGRYWITHVFDATGSHAVTVWARDTAGNWGRGAGSVDVRDRVVDGQPSILPWIALLAAVALILLLVLWMRRRRKEAVPEQAPSSQPTPEAEELPASGDEVDGVESAPQRPPVE